MLRRLPLLSAVSPVLLTVMLTSCRPSELPVDRAARESVLLIGNGAEPNSLDPTASESQFESVVVNALLEGLVILNPSLPEGLEPGVAERWEVSGDYRTWTFHLRKNARWSNGDPVVAEDFRYSFERGLHPEMASSYADRLYSIRNAKSYHLGEITDFRQVGIRVLDDHTLVIELQEPDSLLLLTVGITHCLPVHRATVEASGSWTARPAEWARPGRFVGNGPFVLIDWAPGQKIRVARNPLYWDAASVRLEAVEFYPIEDLNTEYRLYESGMLHITNGVPNQFRERLRLSAPDQLVVEPCPDIVHFRINLTGKHFKDIRVRQALALAIDREAIVKHVTRSGERPATSYVPDVAARYPTLELATHNPQRARELMTEAGYPGGKGFPRFELLYHARPDYRLVVEAVQEMWARELGVQAQAASKEWRSYLEDVLNKNYEISIETWGGEAHPYTFLAPLVTGHPANDMVFSDPVFDRLIDEARRTVDGDQRTLLLAEAERRFMESWCVLPVYWGSHVNLRDPRVQNLPVRFGQRHPLKHTYLETGLP